MYYKKMYLPTILMKEETKTRTKKDQEGGL